MLVARRRRGAHRRGRLAARSTASASEAWATVLFAFEGAAATVGRYSQIARSIAQADEQHLAALADRASAAILRLAAAALIVLGEPIDRDAVLAEADRFLEEVEAEDDGVLHAGSALGDLLQVSLVCLEEQCRRQRRRRRQRRVLHGRLDLRRRSCQRRLSCRVWMAAIAREACRRLLGRAFEW